MKARLERLWLRVGSWLGPGVVLSAGVGLTVQSYLPPFGWDSLLSRVVGWVLLLLVPAMVMDGCRHWAALDRLDQQRTERTGDG